MRTLPMPVYALSPDGKWAVTVDYSRVNDMRAGYGYKGIPDKFAAEKAPKDAGIWRVDLKTGESKPIVSLADAVAIPNPDDPDFAQAKHWFNHLLVSPTTANASFICLMFPKLSENNFKKTEKKNLTIRNKNPILSADLKNYIFSYGRWGK